MDINSIIVIVIAIAVIYFFIRFVASPIAKAIIGVIIFIVLIYLLQHYFGLDLGKILTPLGIEIDTSKWDLNFDWILKPADYAINQIKSFIPKALQNLPKLPNK